MRDRAVKKEERPREYILSPGSEFFKRYARKERKMNGFILIDTKNTYKEIHKEILMHMWKFPHLLNSGQSGKTYCELQLDWIPEANSSKGRHTS